MSKFTTEQEELIVKVWKLFTRYYEKNPYHTVKLHGDGSGSLYDRNDKNIVSFGGLKALISVLEEELNIENKTEFNYDFSENLAEGEFYNYFGIKVKYLGENKYKSGTRTSLIEINKKDYHKLDKDDKQSINGSRLYVVPWCLEKIKYDEIDRKRDKILIQTEYNCKSDKILEEANKRLLVDFDRRLNESCTT